MSDKSDELNRNDPCYCGSNKKYKNCHLKPYYPHDYFVTKLHALDTIHVVNNLPPEIVLSRADVATRISYPWDSEISNITKPLKDLNLNEKLRWQNRISLRLNKLYHKMDAVQYHYYLFKLYEQRTEHQLKGFIVGNHTLNHILDDPNLIYNTEGFLFQIKSCLDVLAQIIVYSFEAEINTYKDNGMGLIGVLEKKPLERYPQYISKIISIIKDHHKWVKNIVEIRDEVAHFSDIDNLSCFMIKKVESKDLEVTVYYPAMPDGQRVSIFMYHVWKKLKDLISECLQVVEEKLKLDIIQKTLH